MLTYKIPQKEGMQETAREISVFCKLSREVKRDSMKVNELLQIAEFEGRSSKSSFNSRAKETHF